MAEPGIWGWRLPGVLQKAGRMKSMCSTEGAGSLIFHLECKE
ncbi:MAG: hypothetical protein PHS80_15120 [Methanothrix sp.]|nr:hypothetical protein [Methanothrix sp.]